MKINYFRKGFILPLVVLIAFAVFTPIWAQSEQLEDGTYSALFDTDSSMFKVNEAHEGRGILTVKDGKMMIHVTLSSKNILNLFLGLAEDAKKEDAILLEPTVDKVTYSDGFEDESYGFDIPVPHLDETFDLALIGKKGKWYDHKVCVSDPIRIEDKQPEELSAGNWLCEVTLQGGSGKASVESPALVTVLDGKMTAVIIWSSKNYEYMLVNDVQYDPVQSEGNSTFEIPVTFDTEIPVSALTVAMSQPHLIDYTLIFDSSSCKAAEN